MSEPYIGQIVMFAGTFAPRTWANCDGQLLAITQNSALFSLLGTIYGGDGRVTFGLPDLRSRAPMHAGSGPGLTPRKLGQKPGTPTNTLIAQNLPSHTHAGTTEVTLTPRGGGAATETTSASNVFANSGNFEGSATLYNNTADTTLKEAPLTVSTAVTNTGGSQSINNMAPYSTVRFIIALFGIYPSRT